MNVHSIQQNYTFKWPHINIGKLLAESKICNCCTWTQYSSKHLNLIHLWLVYIFIHNPSWCCALFCLAFLVHIICGYCTGGTFLSENRQWHIGDWFCLLDIRFVDDEYLVRWTLCILLFCNLYCCKPYIIMLLRAAFCSVYICILHLCIMCTKLILVNRCLK